MPLCVAMLHKKQKREREREEGGELCMINFTPKLTNWPPFLTPGENIKDEARAYE